MGGALTAAWRARAAYSGGSASGMVAGNCATFISGPFSPPSAAQDRRRLGAAAAAEHAIGRNPRRHARRRWADAGVARRARRRGDRVRCRSEWKARGRGSQLPYFYSVTPPIAQSARCATSPVSLRCTVEEQENADLAPPPSRRGRGRWQTAKRADGRGRKLRLSNSPIMRSSRESPPCQKAGSRASSPNGASSSAWCLVPPAASIAR